MWKSRQNDTVNVSFAEALLMSTILHLKKPVRQSQQDINNLGAPLFTIIFRTSNQPMPWNHEVAKCISSKNARNGSSQRKHPLHPENHGLCVFFWNGDSLSVSDFSWVVAKIGFGLAVEPIFRDIRFLYRIYSLASKKTPITQNFPKHEKSFTVQFRPCQLEKYSFQNDGPKESSAKIPPSPLGQNPHHVPHLSLTDTICNPSLFRTSKHQNFFDCWAWRSGSVSKKESEGFDDPPAPAEMLVMMMTIKMLKVKLAKIWNDIFHHVALWHLLAIEVTAVD